MSTGDGPSETARLATRVTPPTMGQVSGTNLSALTAVMQTLRRELEKREAPCIGDPRTLETTVTASCARQTNLMSLASVG